MSNRLEWVREVGRLRDSEPRTRGERRALAEAEARIFAANQNREFAGRMRSRNPGGSPLCSDVFIETTRSRSEIASGVRRKRILSPSMEALLRGLLLLREQSEVADVFSAEALESGLSHVERRLEARTNPVDRGLSQKAGLSSQQLTSEPAVGAGFFVADVVTVVDGGANGDAKYDALVAGIRTLAKEIKEVSESNALLIKEVAELKMMSFASLFMVRKILASAFLAIR